MCGGRPAVHLLATPPAPRRRASELLVVAHWRELLETHEATCLRVVKFMPHVLGWFLSVSHEIARLASEPMSLLKLPAHEKSTAQHVDNGDDNDDEQHDDGER